MCRRGERKACNHITCGSVDFDFLALVQSDMTFDVTLRDDLSFGILTFSLLRVTFSIKINF